MASIRVVVQTHHAVRRGWGTLKGMVCASNEAERESGPPAP